MEKEFSSQPSIHEEIMNIAQTDFFAVNLILTITAAVNVTLHPNLIGSILDKLVTVVQNHYHGCVIKWLAGFCSRKITSGILPPRRLFTLDSPKAQRRLSVMLDLPEPFGPTTAVTP